MGERTTSFAFTRSQRRSSIQFGDFPTFEEVRKLDKFGIDHITAAKFWFYFRLYLPFLALVAFVSMFLIPFFLADNDDGFAFYGSLLSLVSSTMVILSFFHVLPWRRHPSSLMLQISITSFVVSLIVLIESFPAGKYWMHFNPGGLNLIGADSYNSDSDHSTACQAMSFFVQLCLLAREMWVFSLSMDLVTSITNPFASYRASVNKYHTVIWSVALASATVLVNQPSCQGQFLADGTCWIRIAGTQSPCFWGYFLGWVIFFYLFSVVAMLYAYVRISRGLESTYATRYACVADTFRIVFFYFGYCIVFYFFLSFVYLTDSRIKIVESIYAYFIACRGFFDALVWFFAHGFTNNSANTNLGIGGPVRVNAQLQDLHPAESYDSVTGEVKGLSKAHLRKQPTLTMADIVPPNSLRRGVYYTLRASCRCLADLVGCSCRGLQSSKAHSSDKTGLRDDDPEGPLLDEGENALEEGRDSAASLQADGKGGVRAAGAGAGRPSEPWETRGTEDFKPSDATRSTRRSGASGTRPSQLSNPSTAARSGIDRNYLSDVDLSPQLNFALRAELLYLVTLGIKESVLRLDQRDLHVLMSHSGLAGDRGSCTHQNAASGTYSPAHSRSNTSFQSGSLSQSYNARSQSYTFSPTHGAARAHQHPVPGASAVPHFTRPSMLRRDGSQTGGPAGDDTGSSPNSAHNSMKFPSMAGGNTAAHGALHAAAPHHHHAGNGSYSLTASTAGGRIQYALKSLLCGVMGTHMPGEYGRDPIAATLQDEVHPHLRTSYSANLLHASPSHPHVPPGAAVAGAAGAPGAALGQQHKSPSYQQFSYSHRVSMGGPRPSVLTGERPRIAETDLRRANTTGSTPASEGEIPETDLSYGNISLDEQLLEENIELHQQQYATVPAVAPAEVIFNLNAKHQFRDFRPATFRKLRQMCNLPEDRYLELISQPTKERLSEGASGAFFFYCGEGELVVKTVEKHEAKTLLKILDRYLTYLQSRPDSLLVRFLGLHSISMYGNEFNFVVMKNIFPSNVRMNDKYDIKGSWVNRHATRKDPGKRATCKYCNETFIEGSSDKCPEVVGGHEAVVTLKDSDMINKIRLYPDHAYSLIDILNSDSDALCSMGMMDYSLLVGVKTQQFDIDSLQLSEQAGAGMMPDQRLSSFSDMPGGDLSQGGASGNSGGNGNGNFGTRRSTLSNPAPVDVSVYSSIYSNKHASTRNSCSNVPFESRPTIVSETSDSANTPPTDVETDMFISPGYPARAVVAPSAYYLGVIDILQTWSWSKRLEHLFKVYVLQQPAAGVSCVPPEEYKKRYQKKMAGIIEHSIFIREVTGSWQGKRHLSDPFPLMTNRGSSLSEPSGAANSLAQSLTSSSNPFGGSAGSGNATPFAGQGSGHSSAHGSGLLGGRDSGNNVLAGIMEEPVLRASETSSVEERPSTSSVRWAGAAESAAQEGVGAGAVTAAVSGGDTVSFSPVPLD